MNSQEIQDAIQNGTQPLHDAFWLREIALQLAIMNERHAEQRATRKRITQAGHREQRSGVRRTDCKIFRPSSWNVDSTLDNLRQFNPNHDQPELDELEIGQVSIGTLGTKTNVGVKRTK